MSVLLLLGSSGTLASPALAATQHVQGSVHGFLVLKSSDGKVIAVGDQINVAHGNTVRCRLIFRFKDGSLDDQSTVFRQGNGLHLVSDHHVQKGPSFPKPLDIAVQVSSGTVTYREDKDGKVEVKSEHVDLPGDLANGMVSALLENQAPGLPEQEFSYLTGTPKPRVVKLSIKRDGQEAFSVQGAQRQANRYRIHVELGGIAGVVAPVLGRQPSDYTIWMMSGEVPAFLRLEGALYLQGPIWMMELASPRWSSTKRK